MKFSILMNMKLPTKVGIFISAEKMSCSAELSMQKFYNVGVCLVMLSRQARDNFSFYVDINIDF